MIFFSEIIIVDSALRTAFQYQAISSKASYSAKPHRQMFRNTRHWPVTGTCDEPRPDHLKFIPRQSIPDNAGTKHVNDYCKCSILPLSAASWFIYVCFFLYGLWARRDQLFRQIPKFVRNLPCFDTRYVLSQ